ncbi:MAG TPA: hypothetical protein VGM92_14130 [Candidatus Kapabacteria bacterium]
MITRARWLAFSFFFLLIVLVPPCLVHAQGMTIDSLLPRIEGDLHNAQLADQLLKLIPDAANAHVWGYAAGDFTNDTLPDVALSIYDLTQSRNSVRVYLFQNNKNKTLVEGFEREVPFVESPIEVGLSVEGSVVTITQRTGEQHWQQEGYSIEWGDVVLVDQYETNEENMTAPGASKPHVLGHDVYRNYESLRSRESYFSGTSTDPLLAESFFTLPSYARFREIYPGYGHVVSDTTADFILSGVGLRRDASDLSIRSIESAYNDDYLYLSIRVRDDYVIGGQSDLADNDRVSFWFDTKYTGDRLNRDRRVLSMEGGFPTFRTKLDSLVTNITFALPAHPGAVTEIAYSSVDPLTSAQQEGLSQVRAMMAYDTGHSVVTGYRLTLRIPFSFLGFESNPEHAYETPVHFNSEDTSGVTSSGTINNAATLGCTALVYDVDDASHPNEVTVEATSKFEEGNPSTFGTLVLEPSGISYGEVHPTYLKSLRDAMARAGY